MPSIMTLCSLDRHVHGSHFSLHACKLIVPGLVYASVLSLTGCATSAELDSLRAEVAKSNATAVRAENEASRTQREVAALKAADKPPEAFSIPRTPPTAPSTKPSGYKWGNPPRY